MIRLSVIFSIIHFALAYGLRYGFQKTEELDSDLAARFAEFAQDIEVVLTQPGRVVCEFFAWADGSVGFWILMIATSILWGNVLAFLVRRVFKTFFR